jgi:methylase of polypeptide subunit release factors
MMELMQSECVGSAHDIVEEVPSSGTIYSPVGRWDGEERVADFSRRALQTAGLTAEDFPWLADLEKRIATRQAVLAKLDLGPAQALEARHNEVSYPYECTFGRAELVIEESVFCPTFTNASPLLLDAIDFRPDEHVLDAFAGSGAFGINAALHGSRAMTFDISPRAVACTINNAAANNVGEHIDARLGSLRQAIPKGQTFDLIIANPPLLPGKPEGSLDVAVKDPGLEATIEFIEALPRLLADRGRCYLITSDILERCGYNFDRYLRVNGLRTSVVAEADHGYEKYRIHKIWRPRFGLASFLLRV